MIARVFVPLVGANGESAQVFEAIAGEIAPDAHPARLLPQISELFDFGLYGIGQTVREAVTRFIDARRARLWLGRRNGRVNPWNLRISGSAHRPAHRRERALGRARPCAGGDLPGVRARPRRRLRNGRNPAARTPPATPGVAVGPVDGLRGKLMLVGDYIVQHRAGAGRRAADGRAALDDA